MSRMMDQLGMGGLLQLLMGQFGQSGLMGQMSPQMQGTMGLWQMLQGMRR